MRRSSWNFSISGVGAVKKLCHENFPVGFRFNNCLLSSHDSIITLSGFTISITAEIISFDLLLNNYFIWLVAIFYSQNGFHLSSLIPTRYIRPPFEFLSLFTPGGRWFSQPHNIRLFPILNSAFLVAKLNINVWPNKFKDKLYTL